MNYFLLGTVLVLLLVGTVSAIDTEPPASITDLTYNNATCNQVIFEWTNPADEDFNGTEYWLNDVKGLTNLTAEDAPWILFGGLVNETAYTFSTRTPPSNSPIIPLPYLPGGNQGNQFMGRVENDKYLHLNKVAAMSKGKKPKFPKFKAPKGF